MKATTPEARAQQGTEVDGIYAALLDQRWKPPEIDALTITDAGYLFREPEKPTSLVDTPAFKAARAALAERTKAGAEG